MDHKKYEQRGLIGGIVVNIIMGIAGVWVYQITKIDSIFLDAYFTMLAVVSGIVAIVISKQSKKTSKTFPYGRFVLEPLYAILKSLLTFSLLIYTMVHVSAKAIAYFQYGVGEKLEFGPVIPYEIVMVIMGGLLVWFYRKQNRYTNNTSIMLTAEAKNTLIDSLMSGGIGVGVVFISLIQEGSNLEFLQYTGDFFITLLIVLFSVREPISVFKNSFIELANGVVTNEEVKASIEEVIQKNLPQDMEVRSCHIHKTGMSFRILVHVDSQTELINTNELQEKTKQIKKELSQEYEHVKVNFVFP